MTMLPFHRHRCLIEERLDNILIWCKPSLTVFDIGMGDVPAEVIPGAREANVVLKIQLDFVLLGKRFPQGSVFSIGLPLTELKVRNWGNGHFTVLVYF